MVRHLLRLHVVLWTVEVTLLHDAGIHVLLLLRQLLPESLHGLVPFHDADGIIGMVLVMLVPMFVVVVIEVVVVIPTLARLSVHLIPDHLLILDGKDMARSELLVDVYRKANALSLLSVVLQPVSHFL